MNNGFSENKIYKIDQNTPGMLNVKQSMMPQYRTKILTFRKYKAYQQNLSFKRIQELKNQQKHEEFRKKSERLKFQFPNIDQKRNFQQFSIKNKTKPIVLQKSRSVNQIQSSKINFNVVLKQKSTLPSSQAQTLRINTIKTHRVKSNSGVQENFVLGNQRSISFKHQMNPQQIYGLKINPHNQQFKQKQTSNWKIKF